MSQKHKIGVLIPTKEEAIGAPSSLNLACGYGAGKAAACAMAADLIFRKGCDRILIWGTSGGVSQRAEVGQVFLGKYLAYSDYDIRPVDGSTGVGFVRDWTEPDGWTRLDNEFSNSVSSSFTTVYNDIHYFDDGRICTADTFMFPIKQEEANRIETASDVVEMESAAVAEFIHRLNGSGEKKDIQLAVLRIVSNRVYPRGDNGFCDFLSYFNLLNKRLGELVEGLE